MKFKSLMTRFCLLGLLTTPAFALGEQGNDQSQINQISVQTQELQKEIDKLRHEVAVLKKEQQREKKTKYRKKPERLYTVQPSLPPMTNPTPGTSHLPKTNEEMLIEGYIQALPIDWDNPGTSFVAIGPYVNVPIQFNGTNLLVNDPKINTDVALLKFRKAIHETMKAKGIRTEEETHHSHLLLSGILEGQGQYIQHGQQDLNGTSSNFDFTTAELDGFLLTPSPWVSGFFAFSYDNSQDPIETNSRVLNSRLFLNNAFIIIGDFTQSSFYGTLGQMYVPFGTYSSVFVSSPLTRLIARTKARAMLVGYQGQAENAFYTAVYAFKGDSHASSTDRINNAGINMGYKFDIATPDMNGDLGLGWIANMADAIGMQNTNNQPMFNGFGGPSPFGNEKIVHRVPALDLRAKVSVGDHIDLIGEYVGATTGFNPNDMTFNVHGAKPWALNAEAAYTFEAFCRPTSVGIGYGQANEALALGLPNKRYGAVFNTSIWRNTIQSIEFRHDINYAMSDVATGSNVVPPSIGMGKSDNVVTAQFDLYF